ncbi:MAG TPA: M48 family metalloprotease, partial [Candidatus Paceibacterota bacterium]|nr:M48 family metalloprotease [Candidatus Paceibacterota bacterium]
MNFASYWYSDKIALSLAKAHPATREKYFDFYNLVENLSITAGLPMPKIYVIEDSAPNAFATGRDKKHAVIAVTTGLLALMNKTELEGVVAHEMSHIGNKDILLA